MRKCVLGKKTVFMEEVHCYSEGTPNMTTAKQKSATSIEKAKRQ